MFVYQDGQEVAGGKLALPHIQCCEVPDGGGGESAVQYCGGRSSFFQSHSTLNTSASTYIAAIRVSPHYTTALV